MIQIRELLLQDLEWARQLHNDPDVLCMLTDPTVITKEQQMEWYKNLCNTNSSKRLVALNEGSAIGLIRLDQIDKHNKSVCVGMDIHRSFRGKGFAKLIYRQLIKSLFEDYEFNRLWLLVANYNTVARKLYTKLGFLQEGIYRQALLKDGKYYDYVLMSILRDEYNEAF